MATKSSETKENIVESARDNCFIITPIGAIDSDTFKKTTGLISSVIDPVLEEYNFKALPAYDIPNSGSINRQILKSILTDKLVIANLTGLNPNVMYELAVRHAVRLPIIIMAESGTNLPFDITDQRTIFYHDTLLGAEEAKPKLRIAIKAALDDKNIDNPIYQVVEEASIIKADKGKEQSINEYLIRRFDQLENNISSIRQRIHSDLPLRINPILNESLSRGSNFISIKFKDKSLTEDRMMEILRKKIALRFNSYSMTFESNAVMRISQINAKLPVFNAVIAELQKAEELNLLEWSY